MPKRITYLTKRSELSAAHFSAHWSTLHAAIAVNLPGIESYRQNHVVGRKESAYDIDGIVELWFANDDVVSAGIDSDVAEQLIEDEPRFLSGLVGGAVRSGAPTMPWPFKIWVLARWSGAEQLDGVEEWATRLARNIGAAGHAVNVTDETGPRLSREKLFVNPRPPQVAVAFGFGTDVDLAETLPVVSASVENVGALERVEVLFVDEVVIV